MESQSSPFGLSAALVKEFIPRLAGCARQMLLVTDHPKVAALVLCLAGVCFAAESASQLARRAQKAEKAGRTTEAYLLYSQAAAADPKETAYWVRSQALRGRAMRESNALPALNAATPAQAQTEEEPKADPVEKAISPEDQQESRRPLPPKELDAPPGLKSFDFRGDAKQVFEKVAKEFGFDLVFDADYTGGSPFRFQLQDVDYRTALRALQAATSSFVVPLSNRVFIVYKDTQQKRNESEPTVAVTLSLPNPVTVQEAQEAARAVQQAMEIQKFAIDSGRRMVLIKDKVTKVRAAQTIYEQLLTHRSQLLIEIELMDAQSNKDLSYGITLPTQTAVSLLGRTLAGHSPRRGGIRGLRLIPEIMQGFSKFVVMGGGLSTIALAVSDATAFASTTQSSSQSLYRAQIRSVDGQAASLHIGDKYPLITSQYTGAPSDLSPLATPTQFSFEDLGITLKITPRVHDDKEVTMQIEAEYKVLGNGSLNGIPVIANRKFASTVRLRDGEYAVLAGLLSSNEARSISGLFSRVPALSHVLANNSRSTTQSDALVVIKPQIIDFTSADWKTKEIYIGSEGRWNTLP